MANRYDKPADGIKFLTSVNRQCYLGVRTLPQTKTWPVRHGQKWCVSIHVQHLPYIQDEVCYDPLLIKAICFTDYFTILGSVTYLWITT